MTGPAFVAYALACPGTHNLKVVLILDCPGTHNLKVVLPIWRRLERLAPCPKLRYILCRQSHKGRAVNHST